MVHGTALRFEGRISGEGFTPYRFRGPEIDEKSGNLSHFIIFFICDRDQILRLRFAKLGRSKEIQRKI